jgi:anti-sigma regulatory factor (Ser/Thr protein kinase)
MDVDDDRRRKFDLTPENVRAVRSFVREIAVKSGADPDAAAVLASELAANAVVHANTDFEVHVPERDEAFRVEVINDAPEIIVALRDPSDDSGRGLHIVDALAQRWGTESTADQKIVWFELPTG